MRDKLIAESIVSFSKGYNVEEGLLGQIYRFELNDCFELEVILPQIITNGIFGEMIAPDNCHGNTDVNWGVYSPASKDCLPACHIESVYVRLWADEGVALNVVSIGYDNPLHQIQRTLSKLLQNIRIINPGCVMRINGRQFDGGDIEHMKFAQLSSNGVMTEWSVGKVRLGEFYSALSKQQLLTAFKKRHNDVSVPYSLYESARSFLDVMDTRNCILALATMVEVVYKQRMDEYFVKNDIPIELQEYLKRNTGGISKYAQLFKKLGIEYHEKTIKDAVMMTRHRVIHANYLPTRKEAFDAYLAGGVFLEEYRIPRFITIK